MMMIEHVLVLVLVSSTREKRRHREGAYYSYESAVPSLLYSTLVRIALELESRNSYVAS